MKKTFDFDFRNGEFNMKNGNPVVLEGVDALKMWIQKCIRTQLNRYSIYKGKQAQPTEGFNNPTPRVFFILSKDFQKLLDKTRLLMQRDKYFL